MVFQFAAEAVHAKIAKSEMVKAYRLMLMNSRGGQRFGEFVLFYWKSRVELTLFTRNPGSDRKITPEFTTDRLASHTLTHLTQRILIYGYCSDTVFLYFFIIYHIRSDHFYPLVLLHLIRMNSG